jgi:hypothetical protein
MTISLYLQLQGGSFERIEEGDIASVYDIFYLFYGFRGLIEKVRTELPTADI